MATEDLIGLATGVVAGIALGPEAAPVGYIFGQNVAALLGAGTLGSIVGGSVFGLAGLAMCQSFSSGGVTYVPNKGDLMPPTVFADEPNIGFFLGGEEILLQ
jgi:hypothetical protein